MRVDLGLFEGDILLDRGSIRISQAQAVDRFSHFRVTHHLGADVADVVLSDFADHIDLKKITLDMPIHESTDWESIDFGRYAVAFWCRLDA